MTGPKIEAIDYSSPDKKVVGRAATILGEGGLVVAPTETRYGLLARADQATVVSRLYSVKGRPASLPTAIFVKSITDAARYGTVNAAARRLAEKYLPGPLTLVLRASAVLDEPLVVEGKIGIRMSAAPFITQLLRQVTFPVTATSANPSGGEELDTIDEIARAFGGKIELYIDVGVLDNPVSTVVDVSSDNAAIIRQGAIPDQELFSLLDSQLI
ncbi:MAG: threonylcarbamoyl-AMP synthase [Candidatus Zixiibacteriota bacterium]|nr:MAG: threonylcarbamoyl-AMP synthase [candidate division Zixibacteria bacterium]